MVEVLRPAGEDESALVSEALLAEHLESICASPAFEGSTTLRNLLRYLYQRRKEQISEYTIAVEALSRKSDFDPQVDATVRVQISRLRRRLKDYYLAEGPSRSIRFSIPLGTHQLVFDPPVHGAALVHTTLPLSLPPVSPPLPVVPEPGRLFRSQAAVMILSCLVAILAVLSGWQFWQLKVRQHTTGQIARQQLLPLWTEFLNNGKPAQIVLPNPTFFDWGTEDGEGLMARDTAINNFMDLEKSPRLMILERKFGKPQLAQYYAVSSDVLASTKLMRYLNIRGTGADIAISSDASAELFEGQNVILMGTPGTLTPFRSYMERLYFQFDPQGGHVLNPSPLPSEPRVFNVIGESPSRTIVPGLIAYIPGTSKDTHLLIIAGRETAALIAYLISTSGSQELARARNQAGGGPYFETVVLSEMTGYTVLNNHLVAFRSFTPKAAQN